MNKTEKTSAVKDVPLEQLTEEEFLSIKICDLPLQIQGTWLEQCIEDLYGELEAKGITKFRPECYLSDEWLTPDQEPVIGIPFYLAHPALIKLEEKMMLEAEGGTKEWCMRLLRHEAGHAINYAYKFYKRRKWRNVFGAFSSDYPETYRYKPYSRNFVRHLEEYYAQYHPDEDFAETFAVWLTPDSHWQDHYKGWKALRKLEYVDQLMRQIAEKEPLVKKGKKYWMASKMRKTLRHYYKQKRHFWAEEFPDFHDANLKKIFVKRNEENRQYPLVSFIARKYRRDLLKNVSLWTGEKKYVINDQFKKINQRLRDLHLVSTDTEAVTLLKLSAYLTALIMNYRYTGWFRGKK